MMPNYYFYFKITFILTWWSSPGIYCKKQTLWVYVVSAVKRRTLDLQSSVLYEVIAPDQSERVSETCNADQPKTGERGSLSVASREVTIEQHHRGLLSVKCIGAGYVLLQNAVYAVVFHLHIWATTGKTSRKTKYTTDMCLIKSCFLYSTSLKWHQTNDENTTINKYMHT